MPLCSHGALEIENSAIKKNCCINARGTIVGSMFHKIAGFFSYFTAQCVVDEVEVAMFKHFFFIQNKRWTGIHTLTHIQFQVGGSSKVALYSGLEFKVKAPNLIVLCSFSSAETRLQKKIYRKL